MRESSAGCGTRAGVVYAPYHVVSPPPIPLIRRPSLQDTNMVRFFGSSHASCLLLTRLKARARKGVESGRLGALRVPLGLAQGSRISLNLIGLPLRLTRGHALLQCWSILFTQQSSVARPRNLVPLEISPLGHSRRSTRWFGSPGWLRHLDTNTSALLSGPLSLQDEVARKIFLCSWRASHDRSVLLVRSSVV